MTDKQNTGGPAFPSKQKALMIKSEHRDIANEYEIECNGMTLRDYFAAKAMQGLVTSRHTDYENGWYDEERLANSAYNMADAMLKARNN